MTHDFAWIYNLYQNYKMVQGHEPFFISDWDVDPSLVVYPEALLKSSLQYKSNTELGYQFSDDLIELKSLFANHLKSIEGIQVAPENVALVINSTNAIYLVLLALYRKKCKRFLLTTPIYYTFPEILTDLNCDIVYYHLLDNDGFIHDVDHIRDLIVNYNIEVLVITDPVYCSGRSLTQQEVDEITELCSRYNVWLVVDTSLSGLDWKMMSLSTFQHDKFNKTRANNRTIIISSLSKSVFLNSVKYATVLGPLEIVKLIEDLTSTVSGGFCISQLWVFRELYQPDNFLFIQEIGVQNLKTIKSNYSILGSALLGTEYALHPTDCGYFTMIAHESNKMLNCDIPGYISSMMNEFGLRAFPATYFNYSLSNRMAIRVNLLKNIKSFLPQLLMSIDKNLHRFHQ